MAIVDQKEISGSGFKKTIDEDSVEMILDMTQVFVLNYVCLLAKGN